MHITGVSHHLPWARQSELEKADGCEGKYTVGLGQNRLAFVDDRCVLRLILVNCGQPCPGLLVVPHAIRVDPP